MYIFAMQFQFIIMLSQSLQQKLQQKLSPQQIQLMKLLQVPTIALEQRIKQEMEENMALVEGNEDEEYDTSDVQKDEEDLDTHEEQDTDKDEFDIEDYLDPDDLPDYKYEANNQSADDEVKDTPFASASSFQEYVLSQLGFMSLSETENRIAEFIIGNLDDAGYLRRETLAMVDDLAFTQGIYTTKEEVEALITLVQSFDPPGIGARDLQECLLLQLDRMPEDEDVNTAKRILSRYFEPFSKKHYDNIMQRMGIEEDELKGSVDIIIKLNPKPGSSLSESQKTVEHIIPDFLVGNEDGQLVLQLHSRNAPELNVSRHYREMLETYAAHRNQAPKQMKEAIMFVKQKIDSAKWFIDAIKQRHDTLYTTMEAILYYQKAYFLTGDETKLKPMILKDIAERVGLDISTISRVVNSKYVQTSFGTFLLKTFFSESMQTQSGEEVSTREIKKILQSLIEKENKRKPYTDDKLAEFLVDKGYNIARRTIAKYREQLNIPVARMRKEI